MYTVLYIQNLMFVVILIKIEGYKFTSFCNNSVLPSLNKVYYYVNTKEIPGELSRENLVSSHVKITCYLHM